MEKLLTISVAAYNVENYIRKALQSISNSKYLDYIETIVIDDGGTDHTLEIANEFCAKFPDTFKIIHKKNGGYGSTVNESIKIANGKFFKLLDGDDWLKTEGLDLLIDDILNNDNVDIYINKMFREFPNQENLFNDDWNNYKNQIVEIGEIAQSISFGMWEITVKTKKLRDIWIDLPTKTFYTDHLFILQAINCSQIIKFSSIPVYCYRLGCSEQSVSPESRKKHFNEIVYVAKKAIDYYSNSVKEKNEVIKERVRFTYMEALGCCLAIPFCKKNVIFIRDFEAYLKNGAYDIYLLSGKKTRNLFGILIRIMRKNYNVGVFLLNEKMKISLIKRKYFNEN